MTDVLIIGAGTSGLMAGRELVKHGQRVTILEARSRMGGRIHTVHNDLSQPPVELGAEFIHGNLPVTFGLLNEAGIRYDEMQGEAWRSTNGKFSQSAFFTEGWDELEEKLRRLKQDVSIASFLEENFSGDEYTELRKSVMGFAEGYDAADTSRASTFALRDEWLGDDDQQQYRVRGGYGGMIDFLAKEIMGMGGEIHLLSVVKEIQWQRGNVSAITLDGVKYGAGKVIITLPLGVLQQEPAAEGSVIFSPPVPPAMAAFQSLGYGAVIKTLLQFQTAFWKEKNFEKERGVNLQRLGFLFSDVPVPTWWTQFPSPSFLLTGWLGGPKAALLRYEKDEIILEKSLESLASVFQLSIDSLREKLTACYFFNWNADPFARGAYAYATVESVKARKELSQPVEETLYFAGEALYEGTAMGTVEAALASGLNVAEGILKKS